ncbi:MAG: nuclear transport factor 2 family protein [Halioglobus sp.]
MNTLDIWHELMEQRDVGRLDEVLHDDCVFLSPVVHTPQVGKDMTRFYLTGAMNVFNDSFRYVKEIVSDRHAMLEFECEVDGLLINGVDIMTFAEDGRIIEFKVMVRPLKAINKLHEKMRAMLEQMAS